MPTKRMTAAERRALIRKRLAESEDKQEDVNQVVNPEPTPQADVAPPTTKPVESGAGTTTQPVSRPPARPVSSGQIGKRITERRQSRPTNYKIHVITALSLTLTIRILALGPKAAFGKS